jgi:HTH-type transcriptional regulator / antitoxin HigA
MSQNIISKQSKFNLHQDSRSLSVVQDDQGETIPKEHADLLCLIKPVAIEDEEEYQRANKWLDKLENLGDSATTGQIKVARLLAILVEAYEDRYILEKWSSPSDAIKGLLAERGLRQKDLVPIIGNKSNVSAIVNGSRAVTKKQAKDLAAFLNAPISCFL